MRVASLFCGCGGFDLGARGDFVFLGRRYARLATQNVIAIDADASACAIYNQNLGPVTCARVEDIREWPAADLVIAGPPCQPFSAAGSKRGRDDARNALPALVEALDAIRPRAALVENVPGLVERAPGRPVLAAFLNDVRQMGYVETVRVIDAADFGAPTHRRRLFIALVQGAEPFAFPAPTHGPGTARPHVMVRPHVTVREAIADLHAPFHLGGHRRLREGERVHPQFGASARRVIADEPFPTIKAADSAAPRLIHPWFDRPLTMAELLRAQSFPDDFIVPRRTGAIGNAVPPVLAWHLVRAMVRIAGIAKSEGKEGKSSRA
ncbi:MAG: DNA cytosine methyltransferase [Deltaproteobacteria bacterium]|nr:DNA cytosine methyltransferase [Deltaproteobacteria bacterium]